MLTYLLRRLLLMPPTLIGMTAIVFFVVANAPGGIGASLLSRTGEMRPDERRAREEYLNQRYGLDKPKYIQYLRWLNKVSPVGFAVWQPGDEAVKAAAAVEAEKEAPTAKLLAEKRLELARVDLVTERERADTLNAEVRRLEAELKDIRVGPDAGDLKWTSPRIKVPDLGDSFVRSRPVSALVGEALPRTLMLQAIALPISYTLAIWLGIQQAKRRGKTFDYSVSGLTLAVWSIPSIWVATLLIGFLANDQYLRIFPTTGLNSLGAATMPFLPYTDASGAWRTGWLLDRVYHILLPLICLTYGSFAFLSRLTRGALLDNLYADFVRTARAKGLSERVVLYRHAFRNSLIPLITVIANLLPAMIAGSVIVETVFGIQGMGRLFVEAAQQRDFELMLSLTLVVAILQLTGYLLADIGYALADPRVSYG